MLLRRSPGDAQNNLRQHPKDDYLPAYALVGQADYLVTGDKDLLVLQELISDFSIPTPWQFVDGAGF